MELPAIRIQFSWLLYGTVSRYFHDSYGEKDSELASGEQCEEWAEAYRKAWVQIEQSILQAACDITGLRFRLPIIDVSLAPGMGSISSPLIINFDNEPSQFTDILMHELAHVLLTDNHILTLQNQKIGSVDLLSIWYDLFGKDHTFDALVHIPVHAICKYLYLDILKEPERLARDQKSVAMLPDYKAAWDYVDSHDYHLIIKQLQKSYYEYQKKS